VLAQDNHFPARRPERFAVTEQPILSSYPNNVC